jgi:hypothetical protein
VTFATVVSLAVGMAIMQGLKNEEKMLITTPWCKWELIFDLSTAIPRLKHAVPHILG